MKKILIIVVTLCFVFLTGCKQTEEEKEMQKIIDSIQITKNIDNNIILSDYTNESILNSFQVEWSLNDSSFAIVRENREGKQELAILKQDSSTHSIVLTVTIYGKEGVSLSKIFEDLYIASNKENIDILTIEEISSLEQKSEKLNVITTGTVYFISEKGFWIYDSKGFAFIESEIDVKTNDTIYVRGTASIETYISITPEIVRITNYSVKDFDYSEYQNLKQTEELLFNISNELGSVYLLKGNISYNKEKNVYSVITPKNNEVVLSDKNISIDSDIFKTYVNKSISVIVILNEENVFVPITSSINIIDSSFLSDEEIVKKIEELVLTYQGTISNSIELPTSFDEYYGALVTWKSSKPKVIDETGKIGSVSSSENVELTAIIKYGEASKEVKLLITVEIRKVMEIKDVIQNVKEGGSFTFKSKGVIASENENDTFIIADKTGCLFINSELSMYKDIKIGDTVLIEGVCSLYLNDDREFTIYTVISKMEKINEVIDASCSLETSDLKTMNSIINPKDKLNESEKATIANSKYIGSAVALEGVLNMKEDGDGIITYYISSVNDASCIITIYKYSDKKDELNSLIGKTVYIVAPVISYSIENGWILGTQFSITESVSEE